MERRPQGPAASAHGGMRRPLHWRAAAFGTRSGPPAGRRGTIEVDVSCTRSYRTRGAGAREVARSPTSVRSSETPPTPTATATAAVAATFAEPLATSPLSCCLRPKTSQATPRAGRRAAVVRARASDRRARIRRAYVAGGLISNRAEISAGERPCHSLRRSARRCPSGIEASASLMSATRSWFSSSRFRAVGSRRDRRRSRAARDGMPFATANGRRSWRS